jgi:hypothetical protein
MTGKEESKAAETPDVVPGAVPQHENDYSPEQAEGERSEKAPDYKPTP